MDCIQLTEPGKTTVICAVRLKLLPDTISCILNGKRTVNDCNIDCLYSFMLFCKVSTVDLEFFALGNFRTINFCRNAPLPH